MQKIAKEGESGNLRQVAQETDDLLEKLDEIGKPKEKTIYKSTISPEMEKRLSAISKLAKEGYTLDKTLNAIPELRSNSGRSIGLYTRNNPAGFSWIAFFFSFAVCTQIREWSYFFVSGTTYAFASIASSILRYDISNLTGIILSLAYGFYFPYLRYLAKKREVKEIPKSQSIIYGLLLSTLSALPSYALDRMLGVD